MRIENECAYIFQFLGISKNLYYKYFGIMNNNINYPVLSTNYQSYGNSDFSISNIFFSIMITILIYTIPIIIYRYCILKHPIEHKKAKRISIIYGIISFIVMNTLIILLNGSDGAGASIILWSWVNYKVLTHGKIDIDTQTHVDEKNDIMVDTVFDTEEVDTKSSNTPNLVSETNSDLINTGNDYKNNLVFNTILEKEQDNLDLPNPTVNKKVMFCYNCGTQLNEIGRYCQKCGTKIKNGEDK